MRGWTFANTKKHGGNAEIYTELIERLQRPNWFVTMTGDVGRGKTRLLSCAINEGRRQGWTSVYTSMASMLDYLRSAFAPKSEISYDARWDTLANASVLAIDECDRWNPTPWAQEKFFELIDYRYRKGEELLTIFATNSPVSDLPPYVYSRMRDSRCHVATVTGPDVRQLRS